MSTNKYTRNFRDFGAYPWAGKNMPEYYDYLENGGDGNPGLQYMIQHAMAMYGPYHVVEGCDVTISSYEITGSTGWVMWSGGINEVTSEGKVALTDGQWLIINQGGDYATTGDKPTGVIIGRRVGTNVWDMRDRYDENSNRYFPNSVTYYAQIKTYNDITGNLDNISGYESISANTAIFGDGLITTLEGTSVNYSQITGTSGNIEDIIITNANITSANIDNMSISGDIIIGGNVDSVDISDRKTDIDAFLGIGSDNPQYIGCIYEHDNRYGNVFRQNANIFVNSGGTETTNLVFAIPLTCDKGAYSLKLDDIILWVGDADASDYVSSVAIYGIQNDSTEDLLYSEDTDRNSAGTYTYDISNLDCSGYWKLSIRVTADLTDLDDLSIYAPILKYFYS